MITLTQELRVLGIMLVKDLQQFLGSFTDKLKGNAVSHARIFVEKNGYLEKV